MSKEKYIVKFENRDEFIYYDGCYDDTYLIDKCEPVSLRKAKRIVKEYIKRYGKKEFVILPYAKTKVEYCTKYTAEKGKCVRKDINAQRRLIYIYYQKMH